MFSSQLNAGYFSATIYDNDNIIRYDTHSIQKKSNQIIETILTNANCIDIQTNDTIIRPDIELMPLSIEIDVIRDDGDEYVRQKIVKSNG